MTLMDRPSESRTAAPLIGVICGVLAFLATAYVVGYLALPVTTQSATERFRGFRYEWQVAVYWPASRIETLVTGMETHVWHWGYDY